MEQQLYNEKMYKPHLIKFPTTTIEIQIIPFWANLLHHILVSTKERQNKNSPTLSWGKCGSPNLFVVHPFQIRDYHKFCEILIQLRNKNIQCRSIDRSRSKCADRTLSLLNDLCASNYDRLNWYLQVESIISTHQSDVEGLWPLRGSRKSSILFDVSFFVFSCQG